MSDRSLALFKQASADAYRLCREKNHDVSEIDPIWVSVMAGTLTELIVRECAEIVKKEQAFNARYSDADNHPQVNIDQCILIEFGL